MKIENFNLNTILQLVSISIMFGASFYFGYMSQPAEMGLAIVAGALGLVFSNLERFSEFSGAGFSAKLKDQVEALIEKETEPEPQPENDSGIGLIDGRKRAVLSSLGNPSYTWRFLGGIMKDTSLNKEQALSSLNELIEREFAQRTRNKDGKPIWSLTAKGRQFNTKQDG